MRDKMTLERFTACCKEMYSRYESLLNDDELDAGYHWCGSKRMLRIKPLSDHCDPDGCLFPKCLTIQYKNPVLEKRNNIETKTDIVSKPVLEKLTDFAVGRDLNYDPNSERIKAVTPCLHCGYSGKVQDEFGRPAPCVCTWRKDIKEDYHTVAARHRERGPQGYCIKDGQESAHQTMIDGSVRYAENRFMDWRIHELAYKSSHERDVLYPYKIGAKEAAAKADEQIRKAQI